MNAAKELLDHLGNRTLLCAKITYSPQYLKQDKQFLLKVGYDVLALEEFMDSLNIEYDNSYGRQYIEGILWYTDGTWSSRGEYDGSEWWDYHTCPEITGDLK